MTCEHDWKLREDVPVIDYGEHGISTYECDNCHAPGESDPNTGEIRTKPNRSIVEQRNEAYAELRGAFAQLPAEKGPIDLLATKGGRLFHIHLPIAASGLLITTLFVGVAADWSGTKTFLAALILVVVYTAGVLVPLLLLIAPEKRQ